MSWLPRLGLLALGGIVLLFGVYFAASAALLPVHQAQMVVPRIFAYRGWQNVGVRLTPDDWVRIRAAGEWLYTPDEYHGPQGHARYAAPSFYPLPMVPGGALIGRIGEEGAPFYVGSGTTLRVAEPGMLYLRINDDILTDNEGWVQVELQVRPAE